MKTLLVAVLLFVGCGGNATPPGVRQELVGAWEQITPGALGSLCLEDNGSFSRATSDRTTTGTWMADAERLWLSEAVSRYSIAPCVQGTCLMLDDPAATFVLTEATP